MIAVLVYALTPTATEAPKPRVAIPDRKPAVDRPQEEPPKPAPQVVKDPAPQKTPDDAQAEKEPAALEPRAS